jgi:hypothetical protein
MIGKRTINYIAKIQLNFFFTIITFLKVKTLKLKSVSSILNSFQFLVQQKINSFNFSLILHRKPYFNIFKPLLSIFFPSISKIYHLLLFKLHPTPFFFVYIDNLNNIDITNLNYLNSLKHPPKSHL